jgi:hypothetical protein
VNLGDLNVEIWQFILQSGDWWTPQEIDRHFEFKPGTSFRRLHDMQRNGTLQKKPVQGTRSVKFAVTAVCMVPRGVPVGKAQVRQLAGEQEGKPA